MIAWPAAKRFLLIQDLLKTIEPADENVERPDTLSQALGLLAPERPAPNDEEPTRWRNEHGIEKYDCNDRGVTNPR